MIKFYVQHFDGLKVLRNIDNNSLEKQIFSNVPGTLVSAKNKLRLLRKQATESYPKTISDDVEFTNINTDFKPFYLEVINLLYKKKNKKNRADILVDIDDFISRLKFDVKVDCQKFNRSEEVEVIDVVIKNKIKSDFIDKDEFENLAEKLSNVLKAFFARKLRPIDLIVEKMKNIPDNHKHDEKGLRLVTLTDEIVESAVSKIWKFSKDLYSTDLKYSDGCAGLSMIDRLQISPYSYNFLSNVIVPLYIKGSDYHKKYLDLNGKLLKGDKTNISDVPITICYIKIDRKSPSRYRRLLFKFLMSEISEATFSKQLIDLFKDQIERKIKKLEADTVKEDATFTEFSKGLAPLSSVSDSEIVKYLYQNKDIFDVGQIKNSLSELMSEDDKKRFEDIFFRNLFLTKSRKKRGFVTSLFI